MCDLLLLLFKDATAVIKGYPKLELPAIVGTADCNKSEHSRVSGSFSEILKLRNELSGLKNKEWWVKESFIH